MHRYLQTERERKRASERVSEREKERERERMEASSRLRTGAVPVGGEQRAQGGLFGLVAELFNEVNAGVGRGGGMRS